MTNTYRVNDGEELKVPLQCPLCLVMAQADARQKAFCASDEAGQHSSPVL